MGVGGGTIYNLRCGTAVSTGSRIGGGHSKYSSGSLNINLIFNYLYTGLRDCSGRHVRTQAIRPQNWTCLGIIAAQWKFPCWNLGFWGREGCLFFLLSSCQSVLDLTLQETGAALLDFVRSCICFIAGLNLAPKPL